MKITVHERNMDTGRFGLSPAKGDIFDRLRMEKINGSGIPELGDILGLEVVTGYDGKIIRWVPEEWFIRTRPGMEYLNPEWSVDSRRKVSNKVNDPHLSRALDAGISKFMSREFPNSELVEIYALPDDVSSGEYGSSKNGCRRYVYDLGGSRLYMVFDVALEYYDRVDSDTEDHPGYIMRYSPSIKSLFLFKDSHPGNDEFLNSHTDIELFHKYDFDFSKDMDYIKGLIQDIYVEQPRIYKYMLASSLSRSSDLMRYASSLVNKLLSWAKSNGVKIDEIRQDTDHDDYYTDTLIISTYNIYYDDIAKFLKDEKKNAPGWVDYGIRGLY